MIRKATEADTARIVEMVGHFILTTRYAAVLKFRPAVVGELVTLVNRCGVIFVAELEGRVVGMIAAVAMEELVAKTPMLDEMVWWVEPEHRAGSIGPKLLGSLEKWARQKGLSMVKMVAPAGSGVGKYYKRLGYEEVESSYMKRLN